MKSGTLNVLEQLRRYESRNVTFIDPEGDWPVVWEKAQGVFVYDTAGYKYLDLTAAFGVAAAGHANSKVVAAGQKQMGKLLHAMGDVHPHALKAELAGELSALTFQRWRDGNHPRHPSASGWGKSIFCNSGFEAVEAALKTARLATGKSGVIAFEGAYHGLGYGALNLTHREHFRGSFANQLAEFGRFAPYPSNTKSNGIRPRKEASTLVDTEKTIHRLFKSYDIGAVLVEPIQARGGIRVPPKEFLPLLRRLCDQYQALLICDEIYTGFGRTGAWFACEHSKVRPDIACIGKALTGGFPLSVCIGSADIMDQAWPVSTGEAIHTSTFLGHPVGCAMALANIREIQRRKLVAASLSKGSHLEMELKKQLPKLQNHFIGIQGLGLMQGVEIVRADGSAATEETIRVVKRLLHQGFIVLPEGKEGNVIGMTPPLTISRPQLTRFASALQKAIRFVCEHQGNG